MKTADLNEATQIASRVREIAQHRERGIGRVLIMVAPAYGQSERQVQTSSDMIAAIDKLWRRSMDQEEAALRRRAAQIGLALEARS